MNWGFQLLQNGFAYLCLCVYGGNAKYTGSGSCWFQFQNGVHQKTPQFSCAIQFSTVSY
jgi:hypothetical protein